MIASLTRSIILLQLLMLAGLAALMVQLHWLAWTGALLVSAAMLVLVRACIIVNNYFLSNALRQPMRDGRPIPKLTMLARIAQEFWCSMHCWFGLFPLARPFRVTFGNDGLPPVLMLHGYGANSGFWQPFASRLRQERISHAALDLEPVLADIDDYAALIETETEALLQSTAAAQLILLCHSMGGLAARAWIRRHGAERIAAVITLGTPHAGTTLASYGMGLNARQMQHSAGAPSPWLVQLAASESDAVRALFVSISTQHDNIVAPQSSPQLPGANHIVVDLIGHVALGFDEDINHRVLEILRTARDARQAFWQPSEL
jgi:pimeloyl-ACP methyl ester carboxylesterase